MSESEAGSRSSASAVPGGASASRGARRFGWTCHACTYEHRAPHPRCVMCGSLRIDDPVLSGFVTTCRDRRDQQQEEDDDARGGGPGSTEDCGVVSTMTATTQQPPQQQQQLKQLQRGIREDYSATYPPSTVAPAFSLSSASSATVVRRANPYAKKNPSAPCQATANESSTSSSAATTIPGPLSACIIDNRPRPQPPHPPVSSPVASIGGLPMAAPPATAAAAKPAGTVGRPPDAFGRMMMAAASASSSSKAAAGSKAQNWEPTTLTGGSAAPTTATAARKPRQQTRRYQPHQHPTHSSCFSYRAGHVPLDQDAAQYWYYPTSDLYETRQYQVEMTETCLFHNTLVSLPTGLGKTLIAASVLYNYHLWYPTGTVVFCAPTLPLVHQQVQACGEVWQHLMDPQTTAVLTGQMHQAQRRELWSSKRIIFATPQTVHNDLEQGLGGGDTMLDATKVVLLVLDEAHKATGQYSYVRIVQLLDDLKAKYRIVGLSATPGANIKAIQKVVDALRITMIDARADDDPTVAPYTHNRTSETVVVPNSLEARHVDRAITDLLQPYLEAIRKAMASSSSSSGNSTGRLPLRLNGNSTLTKYQILKAREELKAHDPALHQRLQGYLHVAHTFVGLRDYVHAQGIGMVKMSLQAMLNERHKGLMVTVLKEEPFRKLCEAAGMPLCDGTVPNDGNDNVGGMPESGGANDMPMSAQDRLDGNPKLSKLCEILTEHFERAKAVGASPSGKSPTTRAIVFSQYRESVSEIVHVLKYSMPLIRPRHFIGQGNGPKKAAEAGNVGAGSTHPRNKSSGGALKGMKQSEQHQVIRDFRQGVYNTLVCTCIGEEGLDIGEVDLIVNFDMLRSPIRMIQRVGRTGRKREGRVVCLVTEGPEQQTLDASRQSERKLVHALRNPNAFKCHPTVAMFPIPPVRKDVRISSSQRFHASQVEGHSTAKGNFKRERPSKTCTVLKPEIWRLTEEEALLRRKCFGEVVDQHVRAAIGDGIPAAVLRHFLSARETSRSSEGFELPGTRFRSVGRSVRLLRHIESSTFAASGIQKTAPHSHRVARLRGGDPSLGLIFPLIATVDVNAASVGDALANCIDGAANRVLCDFERPEQDPAHSAPDESRSGQEPIKDLGFRGDESLRTAEFLYSDVQEEEVPEACHQQVAIHEESELDSRVEREPLVFDHKLGQRGAEGGHSPELALVDASHREPPQLCHQHVDIHTEELGSQLDRGQLMIDDKSWQHGADGATVPEAAVADTSPQQQVAAMEEDLFVLPPDDGSSDSEDEAPMVQDRSSTSALTTHFEDDGGQCAFADDFRLPSQDSTSPADTPLVPGGETAMITTCGPFNSDDFRLPSDDDSTSSTDADESLHTEAQPEQEAPVSSASDDVARTLRGTEHADGKSYACKRGREVSTCDAPQQGTSQDDDEFQAFRVKPRTTKRLVICDDTQETPREHDSAPDSQSDSLLQQDRATGGSLLARFAQRKEPELCFLEDTPVSFRKEEAAEPSSQTARASVHVEPRCNAADAPCFLEDTPSQSAVRRSASATQSSSALVDTPAPLSAAANATSADDIVCAVCQSGSSPESDPILLCDGPAEGFPCSVAVHMSCYSIPRDALSVEEWRCDPCDYYFGGGAGRVCCYVCSRDEAAGALKRTELGIWKHVNCVDDSSTNPTVPVPEPTGAARRRLRKMGDPSEPESAPAPGKRSTLDGQAVKSKNLRCPLGDVSLNDGSRPCNKPESTVESSSKNQRKRRRALAAAAAAGHRSKAMRFLDLEAAIGSDEDMEGDDEEEDDLSAIESEEAFMSSFINDSSQFGGYSQEDELDRADPDAAARGDRHDGDEHDHNTATLHRTVDMDRERRLAFATPALNRRQHRRNRLRASNRESLATLSSNATTATPASAPSSIKGLGRMHFIRSVLEHHRQGGDIDDVEAVYRNLERRGRRGDDEDDDNATRSPSQGDSNANFEDHGDDDADDEDDEDAAAALRPARPPPVLTVAVPYVDSGSEQGSGDET